MRVPLLRRGAENDAPYTAFLRIPLIRLAAALDYKSPIQYRTESGF